MLFFGLTGCHGSSSTTFSDPAASPGSNPIGINGQYKTCVGSNAGDYELTILSFSGNSFTTTTTYFQSAGCSGTNLGSESSNGTFTVSGNNEINYNYANSTTIYDIYSLDGNTLKIGDRSGMNNGSSDSLRPTTYSSTILYTKQ